MSDIGINGHALAARLGEHFLPDEQAALAADPALAPAIIAAACLRLRGELAAMTTYLPATIVHEQLTLPALARICGDYWEGSVLFADLSGFTALSEQFSSLGKQGAEAISAIINNLFGALVEEIHRYCGNARGGLLKFGGDAITAFFDAAALGDRHAALACQAALTMQQRMDEFAALETRAGVFRLRLRIGVHSGRVFAAQVGDRDHIELVVTGHNINRVALAQEIAEPGEVVISQETHALLGAPLVEQRPSGFYLLRALAEVGPVPPLHVWGWEEGDTSARELIALAERIDALRPYLPRGLPRRFLATSQDGAEAGEFRSVSVLFANFFPFSAVLDSLGDDAATAAWVLNAYYRRAQEIIHRFSGIVNKVDMYTHGDKLMALFGAPIAHEDAPECAVRAALCLREEVAAVNGEVFEILGQGSQGAAFSGFSQRIGINTGVVFAGQVGSAQRREYSVMGPPVNLSARLMSAADVGGILLSPTTRRAVERHIAVRERAPVRLKGVREPVAIVEALHAFEVAQDSHEVLVRAPLVGRAEELEQLVAVAHGAISGAGRVIALVGDAGVGKTRVIEELIQQMVVLSRPRVGNLPAFDLFIAECQSYEQSTPYAALRSLFRQLFHLGSPGDHLRDARVLAKVVQVLVPDLVRFTPLLGGMLGVTIEETPLTSVLSPEQRHHRAHDLVEALVLAKAREHPLVLLIDDVHWVDASSHELLTQVARRAGGVPLLLLLGYRPDPPIAQPWREFDHCLHLTVRELSFERASELTRALLRGAPPAELVVLIEKAQGNPFFIEEVVRGLVESGALQEGAEGWQLTRALDGSTVPDSIEGVISARLDRLEEHSRETLQVASVIGRRFSYPVLSGVVLNQSELPGQLSHLATFDLILPEEIERELSYLFKHALTRDVAYEAILYARRRDLHRRVAQWIARINRDQIDEHLALLAYHYYLAEDWDSAFGYHLRAGHQAQARYANREAIVLYERAIQIAAHVSPPRTGDVLEVLEQLGVVQALIGEYDAALTRYMAALTLLREQPQPSVDGLVRLHYHVARVYEKRAEFETAFEWTERAILLAGGEQSGQLVRCLLLGAGLHKRQGRYSQALEWGEQALGMAEVLGSLREQAQAFKLLGSTHLSLGDTLRALDLARRSIALYEQVQDLDGLSYAHNDLANIYYDLGRLPEARAHYESGASIKEMIGDIYGQGMIANNLGTLLQLQGQIDAAIAQYSQGLAIYERIGSHYMTGVLHMNLGAAHLLRNDLGLAEGHLQRSADLFHQAGAEDFLAELERYFADLHLRRGDLVKARHACEVSLEIAARIEARAEEGMTRRSLGLVLARSGDMLAAWEELQRSVSLLRETASPHEIARTLIAIADLAPVLGRIDMGQAAITEALPIVQALGAEREIAEAHAVIERHAYRLLSDVG